MKRSELKSIIREEIEALTERGSSWKRKHSSNDWEMSREDLASHRMFLERAIPVVKDLKLLIDNGYRSGIFDQKEVRQLQDAKELIESAMFPIALTKQKDDTPKFKVNLKGR